MVISQFFDNIWLCRYPRPVKVVHDNGGEFTGFEFQEMCTIYGVKAVPTTVKNPRSNSAAERMHLTAADMLRTMIFDGKNWQDELDICLQSVAWAILRDKYFTIDCPQINTICCVFLVFVTAALVL